MRSYLFKWVVVIISVFLFDFLFWKATIGVNLPIFTLVLVAYLVAVDLASLRTRGVSISLICLVLSMILVITHNSITSIVSHMASVVMFSGFYYQRNIRSVIAALPTGFFNFFTAPFNTGLGNIPFSPLKGSSGKVWQYIKLSMISIAVFLIFFTLYKVANPVFNELVMQVFESFLNFLERILEQISLPRLLFILLGAFIALGVLFNGQIVHYANWDIKGVDKIFPPKDGVLKSGYGDSDLFSLPNENRLGIMIMTLVNLLLIIVNVIDIKWLWFGFEYLPDMNLSQLVHEGTYVLILSILLSMAIMLYFFTGNLNFYEKNRWLVWLAGLWMMQNTIVVISVAIRNFHYIHYYGLAYKRIGVLVFLFLTLIGLLTLAIKIYNKRSAYFLWRVNSWAAILTLVIISSVNWDLLIARHNLAHPYPEKDNCDDNMSECQPIGSIGQKRVGRS